MRVAKRAQAADEFGRADPYAALALDRLDQDGAGLRADRGLDRFQVAELDIVEAFERRAETFEIFLISSRRDGGDGAPVERALEGDDAEFFRMSARRLIFARRLDRAFDGFGAGIGEERVIGETDFAQARGETLGLRN